MAVCLGALLSAACNAPALVVDKPLVPWHPTTGPGRFVQCQSLTVDLRIHGDDADPEVLWLVDERTGERFDAAWPDGYYARFDPNLEVFNDSNVLVLKEGDQITRVCATGLVEEYWLDPPFQASAPSVRGLSGAG